MGSAPPTVVLVHGAWADGSSWRAAEPSNSACLTLLPSSPSPFRSHAIPLASSARALFWTHELFGLALAQILGRLLE